MLCTDCRIRFFGGIHCFGPRQFLISRSDWLRRDRFLKRRKKTLRFGFLFSFGRHTARRKRVLEARIGQCQRGKRATRLVSPQQLSQVNYDKLCQYLENFKRKRGQKVAWFCRHSPGVTCKPQTKNKTTASLSLGQRWRTSPLGLSRPRSSIPENPRPFTY